MNILKPSYEIVRHTPNMYGAIEDAARTCYLSEPKDTPELRKEWSDATDDVPRPFISFEKFVQEKFIRGLIRTGHQTPFEFADIEIDFICNRGVSHEAVRHRMMSPMQESTRYCNYSLDGKHNGINVIEPVFYDKEEAVRYVKHHTDNSLQLMNKFDVWFECIRIAEWGYNTLLDMGSKPQEARDVLPTALKTKLKMKANIREWWHIFNVRGVSKAAHPQIREVMIPALEECQEKWPILFDHIK